MTRYLIDSWAWIEYLQGSSVGRRVKEADLCFEIFKTLASKHQKGRREVFVG